MLLPYDRSTSYATVFHQAPKHRNKISAESSTALYEICGISIDHLY